MIHHNSGNPRSPQCVSSPTHSDGGNKRGNRGKRGKTRGNIEKKKKLKQKLEEVKLSDGQPLFQFIL